METEYLRKAAMALYVAVDATVANELAPKLIEAADEIDKLRNEMRNLKSNLRDTLKAHDYYNIVDGSLAGDAFCWALDGILLDDLSIDDKLENDDVTT